MDILSYDYADEQKKKIDLFNADPKSISGIVTLPTTIETGETVTIPTGRQAVVNDMTIDGEIVIDGELGVIGGGSLSKTKMITDEIEGLTSGRIIDVDDIATLNNPTFTGTQTLPRAIVDYDDADRVFTIGTSTADAVYEFVSPDGTIVGQNSNGEYVKYIDGSMVCRAYIVGANMPVGQTTPTTVLGLSGYISDNPLNFSFPTGFKETPRVAWNQPRRPDADSILINKRSYPTTVDTGNVSAVSNKSLATGYHSDMSYIAIGRWK